MHHDWLNVSLLSSAFTKITPNNQDKPVSHCLATDFNTILWTFKDNMQSSVILGQTHLKRFKKKLMTVNKSLPSVWQNGLLININCKCEKIYILVPFHQFTLVLTFVFFNHLFHIFYHISCLNKYTLRFIDIVLKETIADCTKETFLAVWMKDPGVSITSTRQPRGNTFLSDDALPPGPAVCLNMLRLQLQGHIKGLPAMTQHAQTVIYLERHTEWQTHSQTDQDVCLRVCMYTHSEHFWMEMCLPNEAFSRGRSPSKTVNNIHQKRFSKCSPSPSLFLPLALSLVAGL